jgi:hypothetical protein
MPTKKVPPPPSDSSLNPDEILIAEFEYIANSAAQANEDRSKAASFFLVAVGSLVAAIFGTQQNLLSTVTNVMAGLFFVLTFLGILTVMQLARLRLAWHNAACAMNRIKKYYTDHVEGLKKAFLWDADSIPPRFKLASVSFYTVLEVSLLGGLTCGAGVFFLQYNNSPDHILGVMPIVIGVLALILQICLYWLIVKFTNYTRKQNEQQP